MTIAATLIMLLGLIALSVFDARRRMTSKIAQLATFPQLNPAPGSRWRSTGRDLQQRPQPRSSPRVGSDGIERLLPGRAQEIAARARSRVRHASRGNRSRPHSQVDIHAHSQRSIRYCEDVSDARTAAAAVAKQGVYAENLIETPTR